jgi:hypothetical protein
MRSYHKPLYADKDAPHILKKTAKNAKKTAK